MNPLTHVHGLGRGAWLLVLVLLGSKIQAGEIVPVDLTVPVVAPSDPVLPPEENKINTPASPSPSGLPNQINDSSKMTAHAPVVQWRVAANTTPTILTEAPSTPVGTMPADPPVSASPVWTSVSRTLRLQLRELILLRQAAQEAGGDLEVVIRPVHITNEDLMVPLMRSGYFTVTAEDNDSVILVHSKSNDSQVGKLQAEVEQLERRRRMLLRDITWLKSQDQTGLAESSVYTGREVSSEEPPGTSAARAEADNIFGRKTETTAAALTEGKMPEAPLITLSP